MDDLIWRILNLDMEDGRALTKRSDAATKMTVLRAVAPRHLGDESLHRLLEALDDADVIRDHRNFVAHGVWGTLDGVGVAMSIRIKSAANEIIAESFSHDRLRQLVSDTRRVRDELVRVMNGPDLPLPDKSR